MIKLKVHLHIIFTVGTISQTYIIYITYMYVQENVVLNYSVSMKYEKVASKVWNLGLSMKTRQGVEE